MAFFIQLLSHHSVQKCVRAIDGYHEKTVGRIEIRYHTIPHDFCDGTGVRDIADAIDILFRDLAESGICCLTTPVSVTQKCESVDLEVIQCRTHITVCRENNSRQSCRIVLDLPEHHLSHQVMGHRVTKQTPSFWHTATRRLQMSSSRSRPK